MLMIFLWPAKKRPAAVRDLAIAFVRGFCGLFQYIGASSGMYVRSQGLIFFVPNNSKTNYYNKENEVYGL